MKKIIERIKVCLEVYKPFVAYNKPNTNVLKAFFQKDDKLYKTEEYKEKGFIFAPFEDEKSAVFIPLNFSKFIEETFILKDSTLHKDFIPDSESKDFHVEIVNKGIKAIQHQKFKKVVLSRKEVVFNTINIVDTFINLLNTYKNAFVYVWYHPKVGLWMGATPETLLKINKNTFETMSLAGTQVFKADEKIIWQSKEIEEQQLVTDYVLDKLTLVCSSVTASEVETVRAGNLLHLKTKIAGKIAGNPSDLIQVLHPTPAVCGFPKKESKAFILKTEGYDRKFYTGFLGELNMPNSELFVNLRCMEIEKNKVNIYVGGGITIDSNSEKEWEETVLKSRTMKRVF